MKKYIKKNILFFCSLFIISTLNSCNSFLDLTPPPTSPSTASIFSSDANAETAIANLYVGEFPESLIEIGTLTLGIYADELVPTYSSTDLLQFQSSALLPDNSYVSNQFWSNLYKEIYNANIIIENLEKSASISDSTKKQFGGEALFFRALSHFTLEKVFGAVPLITVTDYQTNAKIGRIDTATVLTQVIADLQEAQTRLGASYPHGTHTRVNKWAATALMARVYQYMGKWQDAYDEASSVIGSGVYGPLSTPDQTFLDPSASSILQIGPRVPNATSNTEAGYFMPYSSDIIPDIILTETLKNAFEPGDLRFDAWVGKQTVEDTVYFYPAKYKFRSDAYPKEDVILIRLEEMYLSRAEAAAHLGKLSEAVADVDAIRGRAGLPLVAKTEPGISQQKLLEHIYQEQRIEFCFEHGARWYDLKRTGKVDAVLSILKPTTWKPTANLFPIPEDQLLANPFLEPNPGYY